MEIGEADEILTEVDSCRNLSGEIQRLVHRGRGLLNPARRGGLGAQRFSAVAQS